MPHATLVALSPHLDDVALSAAGTVLGWPGRRLLVTVFSADRPGSRWGSAPQSPGAGDDGLMGLRREEDLASCEVLGCEPTHLGLADALARTYAAGEPIREAAAHAFDADAEQEPDVVEATARALRQLLDPLPDAVLLVPAGEGGHRDHAIVRRAAEDLGVPLHGYYEDQPYGWRGKPKGPPLPSQYERRAHPLEPATWETKLRSLACHRSQMTLLWGEDWREAMAAEHTHADGVPTEAIWRAQ